MPNDALPDDPETLKAMLLAERVQNERLRQIIKELQRHRFGRGAETLPEDQMLLRLEDVRSDAESSAARRASAERTAAPDHQGAAATSLRPRGGDATRRPDAAGPRRRRAG